MVNMAICTLDALRGALQDAARDLIEAKDTLTYIDNLSGDGDLGISMEKVGFCILKELNGTRTDSISGLLNRCAQQINVHAPSTMGTLLCFSILEAARIAEGKETLNDKDLLKIPAKMIETIMIHGRAHLGDKTVLDSLIPFSEALHDRYLDTLDMNDAYFAAAQEAERTANATRGCIAKIGRAKWIAERSRDCPDGGAIVCAIIVNAMIKRKIVINI
jgi:dihydroxyacetone kinase